jgi:hypothetical protein
VTPRPWFKAIALALLVLVGGLAFAELEVKVSTYGWNPSDWPMKISMLTDSPGHNAFFLLFIVPVLFAIYLAVARHGHGAGEE